MSRQLNPAEIWSQVPVARRLIEVNTKTGFSLTAGSYSVRASSMQSAGVQLNGVTSNNGTISAVTLVRAGVSHDGQIANTDDVRHLTHIAIVNTTTVTIEMNSAAGITTTKYTIQELF